MIKPTDYARHEVRGQSVKQLVANLQRVSVGVAVLHPAPWLRQVKQGEAFSLAAIGLQCDGCAVTDPRQAAGGNFDLGQLHPMTADLDLPVLPAAEMQDTFRVNEAHIPAAIDAQGYAV